MTREEFQTKSDELFFQVRKEFADELKKMMEPLFEKANHGSRTIGASEIAQIASVCFEASCAYSEKTVLLLVDQLSNNS